MENMVLPAHATTIDVLSDATLMDRLSTFEHYLGAIDHVQSLIVAYLLTEPYKVRPTLHSTDFIQLNTRLTLLLCSSLIISQCVHQGEWPEPMLK